MTEEVYNEKLADLQRYIPFMENMIGQLKDPKWKPREAQLNKMEALYNMITDRKKKWKYETLLKCEEVILKLQSKVKANRPLFPGDKKQQFMNPECPDLVSNTVSDIMNALKFNNARAKLNCEMSTPKSPSPVRDVVPQQAPKIIPFEATNEPIRKSTNIVDPNELSVTWNNERQDRYVNEKPDIYTSAAKSLGVIPPASNPPPKVSIFDRLGPVVPEVGEKPLLTDADLEMLRAGDDFLVICQNDRQTKLASGSSKREKSLIDVNLKVTPRITPVPASKPKSSGESGNKDEKSKHSKKLIEPPSTTTTSTSTKEDDKKIKIKEVNPNTKNKSPKGEKIITCDIFGNCLSSIDNMILEDSKKKDKKKDERRHSGEHKRDKHQHHHKHKNKDKDKERGHKKKEDPRLIKDEVKEKIKEEKSDVKEKPVIGQFTPPISLLDSPSDKPKRLADKYNPKPRKHTEVADGNEVVANFETRDPRRRPVSNVFPKLPMPPMPPILPPVVNTIPTFISSIQQPAISPTLSPMMKMNVQPVVECPPTPMQHWTHDGDSQDFSRSTPHPVFEPPQKHFDPRRQTFHQEVPDRLVNDPRRQARFSPPPSVSPVQPPQFANSFLNIFAGQSLRSDMNFVPGMQRSSFETIPPPRIEGGVRFEPPPPTSSRFEVPISNGHGNQSNTPPNRKGFSPFEPLGKDKGDAGQFHNNQGHFQGAESYRNFRGNFGQSNRFDRFGRRENVKPLHRGGEKFKSSSKEGRDEEKWRSKSNSETDLPATKYDEIYSKLDIEKETFSSPLECLYSNAKTAVKSSMQSFRIPKKPKAELPPPPPLTPVIEEESKMADIQLEKTSDSESKTSLNKSDTELLVSNCTKIVSSDTEGDSDDLPIWKRVKKRSKIANKKKIIDDSDEESEPPEDVKEEEEEEIVRPKRATRQSAIKAIKLITKRSPKSKKKSSRTKRKEEKIETEEIIEEKIEKAEVKEELDVKPKIELIEEKVVKDEIDTKVEIKTDDDAHAVEPEEVKKAKEDLLNEAKRNNLNLNDQGTNVLQFILMNYKKIKKIFKSDSSSEEDEREKKKKRKKRERSSSSDEDERDGRDKKKHRRKSCEDHDDKEEEKIVKIPPEVDKIEISKEEELAPIEEIKIDKIKAPPIKRAIKNVRKVRKGKLVRKKIQGRITRNKSLQSPTKKARRSELDKLHDDIKEMLMGNDLTSTGKRACTMPKEDSEESKKGETSEDPTPNVETNNLIIPSKGTPHLRVLIEKTDIEKLLIREVENDKDEVTSEEAADPPPKLEKMVVQSKKIVKKKILRKKKHRWAAGIIKRKNRRKISTSEDKLEEEVDTTQEDKIVKTVLHDKNYFVEDAKSSCKLCPFKGKLIVQHYKSMHNKSEVLISRMDPATTEHLIRESKDKNYESIHTQDAPSLKKRRFGFKCPFKCLVGTTIDTFENYYDHVTSHTGEHRYICPHCNFSTFNPRNLRAHMVPQHNSNLENHGKPTSPAPPSSKYIFGYVCAICYYVQTRRERLEEHFKNHHADLEVDIVKINLSLICQDQEEVEGLFPDLTPLAKRQKHIHESIETVVSGGGSVRSPEPTLVKDLNIFELMSQIEAETETETDDLPPVLVKMEPFDGEMDLDALIPEIQLDESILADKPKDPDLTVFMCQSDLSPVDDEETIEQRRLKKMNEIHEKCKATRTSIVDKLQSRLETDAQENRNAEVVTPPVIEPIVSAVKPPPLIPIDRAKKSLDSIPKNLVCAEVALAPKKIAPISNIINRLQDKLLPVGPSKSICSDSSLSPSSWDQGSAPSTLSIGPITVTYNRNNDILYSCFIPFCVFNTLNAQIFEIHCRSTHKEYVHSESRCDLCNIKIDYEEFTVSMYDIYRHICTCHADFLDAGRGGGGNSIIADREETGLITEANVEEERADDSTGAKYPFKIANVTTTLDLDSDPYPSTSSGGNRKSYIAADKSMTFALPHNVPNVISQASTGSGPKFPFIITNVTSLAKKNRATTPPPLSTPSPQPPTSAILNRALTSTTSTILVPLSTTTSESGGSIQTSPIVQPYTITSVQSTPTIVPTILKGAENESAKVKLPVISRVQSLAPARKDLIRPVPLKQLTTATTDMSISLVEKTMDTVAPGMLNVVSLVSSDGNTITLQDIAAPMEERGLARKSLTAWLAMLELDVVARFYKCPQYVCSFSCDKSQELVDHLNIHGELKGVYVHCLYCDYKTLYSMYLVHLEVQHANSEYACGLCFYRATNSAFVFAHSKMKHKFREPIVLKTARENMPARISLQKLIPIKSVLKHYQCGVRGCNVKTIFMDVFHEHLTFDHAKSSLNCALCPLNMKHPIAHWTTHGVYPFHCRYCQMGSKTVEVVVNHQSLVHSKMDYCVIYRKFVPNTNFPEKTGSSYTIDDVASYDRLYLLYGGGSDASLNEEVEKELNAEIDRDSIFFDVGGDGGQCRQIASKDSPIPSEVDLAAANATADEPEISILNADLDDTVTDPLSFGITGNIWDGFESNEDKEAEGDVENDDRKSTAERYEEYTGARLYKCICGLGFEERAKFTTHIVICQGDSKSFKCAHCGVIKKSYRSLLVHMNEHGKKRFKCSLCQFKHVKQTLVRDHLNVEHNIYEMMVLPVTISKKVDYLSDDFVLRPSIVPLKRIPASTATSNTVVSDAPIADNMVFSPGDIDRLPRPHIYQTDVFCSICNYATKVKWNMVRHLQAHQNEQAVPETAPVNPVPCLEKSEKMFDKMVNLALSSHSAGKMANNAKVEKIEENHVPAFVPINKRFVCGADSCNYLCPEEGMLRRHLSTFHSQESTYTCLHCDSKLFEDKVINVEGILKHLKLHDNHLYGCGACKFIHNLKHKVERHLTDKHGDQGASLIVFRTVGKEVDGEASLPSEKDEIKKSWRCGMCKFRCTNLDEVKIHTQVKHNVIAKQKCALCEFGSEDLACFGKHFELNHNGKAIDVILNYYKEDEMRQQKAEIDPEFNTTPLWQRNKSVKHIRGILLEDGNNKIPKTTGIKKAKTLKSKKLEAQLADDPLKKDPNLTADPVKKLSIPVYNIPSNNNPIVNDTKKAQPKRRKWRVNSNKITVVAKNDDKKPTDGDVILINNSDDDNSQVIDVVSVDDSCETRSRDCTKSKPKVIVLSDHKLNTSDLMEGEIKIPTDKSKSFKLKPKIVKVVGGAKAIQEGSLEIITSNKEITKDQHNRRKFPVPEKKGDIRRKSINKKEAETSLIKEDYRINLDESSADDSDVIEVINEAVSKGIDDSDHIIADSPFKNVKVVSVCSLKDVIQKREESPSIDDIKDTIDEIDKESKRMEVKDIKVVNVCSLKDTIDAETFSSFYNPKELVQEDVPVEDSLPTEILDDDRSKLDISIQEIESMSKTDLLSGNFIGTYGPYGFPWNGNYKCPLCEKFMSTSSNEFKSHLYQELQYGMYKCTACDFTGNIKEVVADHHKDSHGDIETNDRVVLCLDQQIVDWVDKLIVFQLRVLTLDKEESSEVHFYCHFCDYKSIAQSDMRKHQIRHWTVPPYTCPVCPYKAIHKAMIEKHISRIHQKVHVPISEPEVCDEALIRRIRIGNRIEPGSDTETTCEMDCDCDLDLEDLPDVLMSCAYCNFRAKLAELKEHVGLEHPGEKFRGYRYRCNFCASTFILLRTLDQHFISCHSGMRHSYSEVTQVERELGCPLCPVTDDRLHRIREHLRSHFKMIRCIYCDTEVVYWKTMRDHCREMHPGLSFVFTYLLTVERAYEATLNQIRINSNLLTVVSNKKRRRNDEDVSVVEITSKIKQVARKSTGGGPYKKSKEDDACSSIDYSKIITTIDVMGTPVTMNIIKLSKILNITPVVLLEDCQINL